MRGISKWICAMKILAISDVPISLLYSQQLKTRFPNIRMLISCGDLPRDYQEYIVSYLDIPFYYVFGNHDPHAFQDAFSRQQNIAGGTNLHRKSELCNGVLLAGIEGSLRYREGPHQYTQADMWAHVFSLIPKFMINRIRYGRYLDIFVTHAPSAGIHDKSDLPHQGINAFRWLIETFKPRYHIHGHIHIYRPDETVDTLHGRTRVINAYGYKEIDF